MERGSPGIRFLTALLKQLSQGRMFRTFAGRFGVSWAVPKENDGLLVFDSAPTPHLLRAVGRRDDHAYALVGLLYMDGVMNGEVYGLGLEKQDMTLV